MLVSNQAIINAVLDKQPKTVLDVGCGEGWLARELDKTGVDVLGIDVVPALIEAARQGGAGRFQSLAFEELSSLKETFNVIVCNFSLLGKESVTHLFQQFPRLLTHKGAVIVQTIHPVVACGDRSYEDGWREGSWSGFSSEFSDPAPWYFRTLDSWKSVFLKSGFCLQDMLEPINPKTNQPASVIFIAPLSGEPFTDKLI